MKKIIIAVCLVLTGWVSVSAHDVSVPVIVDTDMASDDIRALIMLLHQDMCDIRLMVTSDGVLSPREGAAGLKILMTMMNREGIPVIAGRDLGKTPPPWRAWNRGMLKPDAPRDMTDKISAGNAGEHIAAILNRAKEPHLYFCLGPLTNLADAMEKSPGIIKKISRVVYFGTPPDSKIRGWNTGRDLRSARKVFDSRVRIHTMESPELPPEPLKTVFPGRICGIQTAAASVLCRLHERPEIQRQLDSGHLKIWDEMCAIYMGFPEIFVFSRGKNNCYRLKGFDREKLIAGYVKMLYHQKDFHLSGRNVVILKSFPATPDRFQDDVKHAVKSIIDRHGIEEWKACVLTNELHRHLGIYSIAGAKMGILARELLNAPVDGLSVVSYAGNQPPLSCLNDGLQVATGASLGRGTIRVVAENRPEAAFTYKNRTVTLRLKAEYLKKIREDIKKLVDRHGGMGREYFRDVRRLSIRYWENLDRHTIFDLVP